MQYNSTNSETFIVVYCKPHYFKLPPWTLPLSRLPQATYIYIHYNYLIYIKGMESESDIPLVLTPSGTSPSKAASESVPSLSCGGT